MDLDTLSRHLQKVSMFTCTTNKKKLTKNSRIICEVPRHLGDWQQLRDRPYTLVDLSPTDVVYQQVSNKFRMTVRYNTIRSIQQVENPFLYGQYLLEKEAMASRGLAANEMQLFHGTHPGNLDSICSYNFDWRRSGSAKGHKFGKGVSFSPSAFYATHYGNRVMFLAKVLVGASTPGNCFTLVPPAGYNSTRNGVGTVYVIYDDAKYYPNFIINYF